MKAYFEGAFFFAVLCNLFRFALSTNSFQIEIVAEFVSVDYLWDSTHSRALYEETGQFVVANNAMTGIKVSQDGQIFVSVPRWMSGVPSSLNKLVENPNGPGYVFSPWPSWEFNAIGNGTLQYSQSFTIDSRNCMWIAEVGRTNFLDANPSLETTGKAGVLVVNITDGTLLSSYYFPPTVASYNSSFVNDIVLDEVNGYAYFTDTWGNGAIIVYDINNNISHSFSGPSTQRNYSYDFCVNNICYGNNGVGASPSDGIALSSDGSTLYWSSVQGQGLYSIDTSFLKNFSMSNAEFQQNVKFVGYKTGCSDGLLYLNGNLFYGNLQNSALSVVNNIESYEPMDTAIPSTSSPASAYNYNWIDTFALDLSNLQMNGIYFTTNKLNLFLSSSMDFTGQSGANFRVFRASYSSSSSSSSTADQLSGGQVAAIVIGSIVFAGLSIAYHEYFHGRKSYA
jgi:intracellular sulfur oxidation DsrE/DsrF family protein